MLKFCYVNYNKIQINYNSQLSIFIKYYFDQIALLFLIKYYFAQDF